MYFLPSSFFHFPIPWTACAIAERKRSSCTKSGIFCSLYNRPSRPPDFCPRHTAKRWRPIGRDCCWTSCASISPGRVWKLERDNLKMFQLYPTLYTFTLTQRLASNQCPNLDSGCRFGNRTRPATGTPFRCTVFVTFRWFLVSPEFTYYWICNKF